MAKQKMHPLFVAFLAVMLLLAILGLILLVGGSLRRPALPSPWTLLRPIALCGLHG